MTDVKNHKILYLVVVSIFSSSCASVSNLEKVEKSLLAVQKEQLLEIQNVKRDIQELYANQQQIKKELDGLHTNQRQLHHELKKLHQETEQEFSSLERRWHLIRSDLNKIKSKTDQFEVRRSNNTLLFVPANP